MTFCQLVEFNIKNSFSEYYAENEAERLIPGLLLFFKKALHEVKASG